MTLAIHDTLSGEKRPFTPRDPSRVTMYVCGPTVYNFAHIGNARPVVVFDTLFRLLRQTYGEGAVIYARNITDVDDKINQAAIDQGVPISVITDRFTDAYHADMDALGALRPTIEPRATAHIDAMLAMIGRLIENKAAYAAEGHVLFDTQAFPDYGKLSGRSIDDMIAGARVEVAPYKRHPADFVLWKPSKPGEPEWPSAWGAGRPGWHLECSAMVETTLGLPIDIHGGGHDLIFPHHENEIAQSRCADHAPVYANYWMHNGFLTMDAEKMSKSLGNVLLVHDLIKQVPGEAIRWALLSAHYRAPLDWTGDLLVQSRKSLDGLYGALQDANTLLGENDYDPEVWDQPQVAAKLTAIRDALEDDLNTPRAIAGLFELSKALRALLNDAGEREALNQIGLYRDALVAAGSLLGFLQVDPETWFQGGADDDLKTKVEALLQARIEARKAKDWPTADRIRDELNALNVVVMDNPEGATWRLADSAG
ncbi:MAG: cysteine--tRNA ligase [Caulobacteraceae bacterium]|nr:cysteine--tRNA ligase [Caulobacteraceae bacterium]